MRITSTLSALVMFTMLTGCLGGSGGGGGGSGTGPSDPKTTPTPVKPTPTPTATPEPTPEPTPTPPPVDPALKEAFFEFVDSWNSTYNAINTAEQKKQAPLQSASAAQADIDKKMSQYLQSNCTLTVTREGETPVTMASSGSKCPLTGLDYKVVFDQEKNPLKTLLWKYGSKTGAYYDLNDVVGVNVTDKFDLSQPDPNNQKLFNLDGTGSGTVASKANGNVTVEYNVHEVIEIVKGSDGKDAPQTKQIDLIFKYNFGGKPVETQMQIIRDGDGFKAGAAMNGEDITEQQFYQLVDQGFELGALIIF